MGRAISSADLLLKGPPSLGLDQAEVKSLELHLVSHDVTVIRALGPPSPALLDALSGSCTVSVAVRTLLLLSLNYHEQ